jgi:hypothetical protein
VQARWIGKIKRRTNREGNRILGRSNSCIINTIKIVRSVNRVTINLRGIRVPPSTNMKIISIKKQKGIHPIRNQLPSTIPKNRKIDHQLQSTLLKMVGPSPNFKFRLQTKSIPTQILRSQLDKLSNNPSILLLPPTLPSLQGLPTESIPAKTRTSAPHTNDSSNKRTQESSNCSRS